MGADKDFITIDDVVDIIPCGVYAKTPKSLKKLFTFLKKEGYSIEDCSKDDSLDSRKGISRDEQASRGYSMWFAKLNEKTLQRMGKCKSCHSIIDSCGIQSHNNKCSVCGEVTYKDLDQGSIVEFNFRDGARATLFNMFRNPSLVVHSYDEKNKRLNFYGNSFVQVYFSLMDLDRVTPTYNDIDKMLEEHPNVFKKEEIDGVSVISTHRDLSSPLLTEKDMIDTVEVTGGRKYNYSIVQLYKGKEFSEHASLPVPEYMSIHEAWQWAPLQSSPDLHEKIIHAAGMVSRCDYYYQDGRQAFNDIHLERMRKFVENLTAIKIDEWDNMIAHADRSGPGMIRTIAIFCHPSAIVKDEPNMGNTIYALANMFSGKPLKKSEIYAARRGMEDPNFRRMYR